MLEGIIFVTVIVFIFMADWRTTVIVAIVIPLSLLFAFICLTLKGMSANLLSMGAIDFGIIIDGAVVMVEGIFVLLDHKAHQFGMERFNKLSKLGLIKNTGGELGKAIFFSKLIIIAGLLPIFSWFRPVRRIDPYFDIDPIIKQHPVKKECKGKTQSVCRSDHKGRDADVFMDLSI
jgi:cobalt-zinc-cadmium resistance protein CzcA